MYLDGPRLSKRQHESERALRPFSGGYRFVERRVTRVPENRPQKPQGATTLTAAENGQGVPGGRVRRTIARRRSPARCPVEGRYNVTEAGLVTDCSRTLRCVPGHSRRRRPPLARPSQGQAHMRSAER